MDTFTKFLPISKVDKEKRLVSGYASTPSLDSDEEIVELEAIKAALPGYMAWGNIREMHGAKAVGVAQEANVDAVGLFLAAYVSKGAADCWEKVLDGTLKGFSIGGNIIKKIGNRIVELELLEISLVDRPANSDCRFEIVKSAKPVEGSNITLSKAVEPVIPLSEDETNFFRKLMNFFKGQTALSSENGNVTAAPSAHEQSQPAAVPGTDEAFDAHLQPLMEGADLKPYGDVEYADPGHQKDGKHRYPVDTEDHIRAGWSYINMPKNQSEYTPSELQSVKDKIESAWKSKIDDKGPPSEADKSASTNIQKGMREVGNLSYAFETLREVQRSLNYEHEIEQDPKDLEFSQRAGAIATTLAGLMAEVATHEGEEATTLTDEEDVLFRQWTGASLAMSVNTNMSKRFSAAFKEHMGKCADHMGKAVACHGEAMEGIRALREMHADAAKAVKAGTVEKMDHGVAMEHVHKCMGALTKMEDHQELAAHHLDKCVKAAGADAGSSEGNGTVEAPGFGGVSGTGNPTGVGNTEGEDDIFAHLGAKGASPAVLKMLTENAYLKGQLEAVGRQPAGAFKARTFDFSGHSGNVEAGNDVLKGVNLNPRDEREATHAVGKAIGNIVAMGGSNPARDPNFKGAAGK